jgi:uncharacterized protein with GYD domain
MPKIPCCFASRRIGNKFLGKIDHERSEYYGYVCESSAVHRTRHSKRQGHDQTSRRCHSEAEKMGLKVRDSFWTLGPYDVVLLLEAPDDQNVTAFTLKLGSLGNVKTQTMRAFRSEEMEGILAKIK